MRVSRCAGYWAHETPGVTAVAWRVEMKRLALGAVAIAAAGWTAAAQAADLPYAPRAPYTVNQPLNAYSGAGPYLGGNLGYAWGSVSNNVTKPSGFEGGVQGGYNWQNGPLSLIHISEPTRRTPISYAV